MQAIIRFVRARINDDLVRANMKAWHTEDCDWLPDAQGYIYPCGCGVSEWLKADCRAKLQIVELYEVSQSKDMPVDAWVLMGEAVEAIATVYANHPDYRDEWSA